MSMMSGTTLVPFYWVHTIAPIQIRQSPVLVSAFQSWNFGVSAPHFLQLHSGNPIANQVPLFALVVPPNGYSVLDTTHLGGHGIAAENMWLAVSTTMNVYTAVGTAGGVSQLMIR